MSAEVVIFAENLGKRYLLTHRHRGRSRYTALRDVITEGVKDFLFSKGRSKRADKEEFWALREVCLEVKRGEVVGVIGHNGAGKSTLLKVVSRITEPTTGRVGLKGRVASLLEVGTGFHPELTGRENVFLNGAILGMTKAEIRKKFDEIVEFAEAERFLDTPVKHYSSGMYMRLAFAVAAHLEPEILLVDEVLAVGDADFQKKCLGKIKEVGKLGRTVLFVSHNMNAIEQLCSAAVLLKRGHVDQFGRDVRAVIQEYLFGQQRDANGSDWRNPGQDFNNPWFKPLRFCITDKEGDRRIMPLANDSEMWIHIEADIEKLDPGLTIGYAVFSAEGHLLYWSYQTDQTPDQWPKLRRGRCVLRSPIPKRFLNEGTYRAELIGGLHCRQWLFEPGVSAPAIFFTIQGRLSDSPLWMVKRPGLLAPVIKWYGSHDPD